jgi:hypothetical protein
VVRLQVGNIEVGWTATVFRNDINVAGVVTLTLLELINSTGVANAHGAAPYPAAPLYNLAVNQAQRGAHWGSSGPPRTIAGLQRELGQKGDGACFLWLERWAFRYMDAGSIRFYLEIWNLPNWIEPHFLLAAW